jgi:heme/copper-type cytochrome/quinol oxidase subunit 2
MRSNPVVIMGIALVGLLALLTTIQLANRAGKANPQAAQSSAPALPAPVLSPAKQASDFDLVVKAGRLATGPARLQVLQGDEVSISVISDRAEEFHLHGYNLKIDLQPNKQATLVFVADKTGRFEYELEKSKTELGALEVRPR